MDLNISTYAVFHGDFESAVQMNPSIAQKSKKNRNKQSIFLGGVGGLGEAYYIRTCSNTFSSGEGTRTNQNRKTERVRTEPNQYKLMYGPRRQPSDFLINFFAFL